MCFVCQFIHYHVLVSTRGVAVKMAVMDTYLKINVHMCVCDGCVWEGHSRLSRVPDTGRPARHRVRGPPRRSPGTAALVAAFVRARRSGGGR